jgi:maltooligosyltrehalose trehalohydrolase
MPSDTPHYPSTRLTPTPGIPSRASPIGAEPSATGTSFRLWASDHAAASVVVEGVGEFLLEPEPGGYFSASVAGVGVGARYRFRLDGHPTLLPDLASRWQPEGPEGASVVCAPAFAWSDAAWRGVESAGQVLYELHLGTFTEGGTWASAVPRLGQLRELGITTLQLMPVAEFAGAFGWGYDVMLPYAPSHLYGAPDDVRRFVDAAHGLGLGVILDVVYNHLGAGNHFGAFSRHYFTDRHPGEWGPLLNFDGPDAAGVREFVVDNAAYWIRDFHFDGLRLDATQVLFDDSPRHIIADIVAAARAAAPNRRLYLIAENQPQDRQLVDPPERGGYGLDALVSDDFHHAAAVALTGHNEFYYADYAGTAAEFVAAAKFGYLFQGQRSDIRDGPYGTASLDLLPRQFVHFLQNHDQIANSARGLRLDRLGAPGTARALTALLLLAPQTPCLFQGQEFAASAPFFYFAGFDGDAAKAIADDRAQSLVQFPSIADPAMRGALVDPADPVTLRRSTLDWTEWETHGPSVALHRDLLALRRDDPAFGRVAKQRCIDGATLGETAFFLRFFAERPADDRLLFLNLGADREIRVLADPLVAPPAGGQWLVLWSSEDPRYGGAGRRAIDMAGRWVLPGRAAIVFGATETEGDGVGD